MLRRRHKNTGKTKREHFSHRPICAKVRNEHLLYSDPIYIHRGHDLLDLTFSQCPVMTLGHKQLDRGCSNGTNTPTPLFINLWWNNCDKAFQFLKIRSKVKVEVISWKILVLTERSCHKEYAHVIWMLYLVWFKSYVQLSFLKSRSNVKALGQKFWYKQKGLATRYSYLYYESPISFGSKVMANVKFLEK